MSTVGIADCFYPSYYRWHWVADGFRRNGWTVKKFRTPASLERGHVWCDLILCSQETAHMWPLRDIAANRCCSWAVWSFDYLDDRLPLLDGINWSMFNFVFSKMPDRIAHLQSHYLDQAAPYWSDRSWFSRRHDVVFVGRESFRRRMLVDACIERGLDVAVGGPDWDESYYHWLGVTDDERSMCELFSSAKLSLGWNFDNATLGYQSDRVWLSLAAGTAYIGPQVDGCIWTGQCPDDDEIPKVAERICRNEHERIKLLERQTKVRKVNRYDHRVAHMLSVVFEPREAAWSMDEIATSA